MLSAVLPATIACSTHLVTSGPGPQAAPLVWAAGESVCVVQPEDGGVGDTLWSGSGATVANRVERVVRANRQVNVILVEERSHGLRACAARHGRYAIVPVILRWERNDGPLFYSESAQVRMDIQRVDDREVLRTVSFETRNSRPNVLVSPHDLLPKEFDDAVLRLLPSG